MDRRARVVLAAACLGLPGCALVSSEPAGVVVVASASMAAPHSPGGARTARVGVPAPAVHSAAEAAAASAPPPTSAATTTTVAPTTTLAPTTTIAPTTAAPPPPAPCRLAYLADSVGADLLAYGLGDALGAVGCTIGWSRVRRGSWLAEGVDALGRAGATPTDVVLVLQGYSKAKANQGAMPALIEQLMVAAGPRTVVWALYGPTPGCSAGYVQALASANRLLVDAATRWPNLRLVDYPTLLAAHPEYDQHDCPHLRAGGAAEVAAWMAGEVRRLVDAPRRPPASGAALPTAGAGGADGDGRRTGRDHPR